MKKLFALLLFLFAGFAFAAPFQPIDVAPGVTSCTVSVDGGAPTAVVVTPPKPPDTQNRCYYDMATYPVGSHSMTAIAIRTDPEWGTLGAAPAGPFVKSRPAVPAAATFEPSLVPAIP